MRPLSLPAPLAAIAALSLSLVGGTPGRADEPQPTEENKKIDDLIAKYVHKDGPGMAVLVLKDGKAVHKKGYGLADLDRNEPITPETTFELASVSKQFTAMAVMVLHDQGKLSFDDDVRKHLPAVPVFPQNQNRPIRIRDLLNHTAGLPDYPYKLSNNEEIFRWLGKQNKLLFPTGTKFEYENTDYALLAVLVETVGKKPFHQFLHDEVFKPLGMKSSVAFQNLKVDRSRRALGYVRKPKLDDFKSDDTPAVIFEKTQRKHFVKVEEETIIVGDGSVWSNLEDMALWDEAVRGKKLVKAETWKEAMTIPKLNNGHNVPVKDQYGFGWWLYTNKKDEVIRLFHGGSWTGFATHNCIYLNQGLSVVLLSNIWHFPDLYPIRDQIHEVYVPRKKSKP